MIIFHKEYMQKLVKKEGYFTAITIKIDSPKNKGEVSSKPLKNCLRTILRVLVVNLKQNSGE